MTTQSIDQLLWENEDLRRRLEEAEEALRVFRGGKVDAALVEADCEQVYTLETTGQPYRLLVEQMPHGAATLTVGGTILYCNRRFTDLLKRPLSALLGQPLLDFVARDRRLSLETLLQRSLAAAVQDEVTLLRADGTPLPVYLGVSARREDALGLFLIVTDLTEQRHYQELRRTQEALRAATERLELAQQAGRIGSFEWDIRTGAMSWSATAEELYGLPVGRFGGRFENWKQTLHPDDRDRAEAEVLRSVAERTELDTEFRIVRPDGETRWLAAKGKGFYDEEGVALRVVGVNIDITSRKRVEVALRESEERLRLALEAGRMGVWDWNLRTNAVQWSDNLEPIHGLAPGTFGGTLAAFQELIHPDDRAFVQQAIAQALEGQSRYDIEFRNVWPDGSVHWMAGKGKVITDNGQSIRMVGVGMDVTDRRRAEQDARFLANASAALAALVDYQSTLQMVARLAVPSFADWCAVDMVEPDGSLRRLAVAHVDASKVELAHELHRRYPPSPAAPRGVWSIIRSGTAELIPEITDEILVATTKDAELLGIIRELGLRSYMGVPLTVRGKVLGVVTFITAESGRRYDAADLVVAEDLAHRAAVAIENSRLYHEVREADRRKEEFLATLAHELRNPLAPIRNAVQFLKAQGQAHPELHWGREVIDRQLRVMARLLEDLLDVSRISHNKVELRKERVELAAVVEAALETSRPVIEAGGHELAVALPPGPVRLEADPVRLAQVFSNLLNNAAKYTEHGGAIRLTAERHATDVIVSVKDSGIGIAAAMLPRIFELFTQSQRALARSQGGLGIGLALARGLVELHGGSIEAKSAGLGLGSEFLVRLPLADEPPASGPLSPKDARQPWGPKCRILIVDDNRDSADTLAQLLKVMGNEVGTAYDGEQAVETAAALRPRVVLLDIGMPRLNGYEACRRIREQGWGQDMILIALTGWGQEEDRRRTEEAGFNSHLVKPVDLASLQELLAKLLSA